MLAERSCGKELRDISAFPGEVMYEDNYVMFNPDFNYIRPAFIAFPESVEDVQRCLQCSAANSVPCVVKSGGHSNSGYSTIDGSLHNGFVISMTKLDKVSVKGDTVVIGGGAWWEDVYAEMDDDLDLLLTGGACPTVGVSGFMMGGGYSFLSRQYGLGIDNVISMTMVTGDGSRVVTANSTTNPDLFWALRGGGGGNFGIVTEITLQGHRVTSSKYVMGSIGFEAGATSQEALATIGRISPHLPHNMFLHFYILSNRVLNIFFFYMGSSEDALEHLRPLTELASTVDSSYMSSYYDCLANAFTPSVGTYGRACLTEVIDEGFAEILFTMDIPIAPNCAIVFDQLGGAIRETPSDETAYFYRSAEFEATFRCFNAINDALRHVSVEFQDNHIYALEQTEYCVGSYVNGMDSRLDDWQRKYYGGNYARLMEIKAKWNPIGTGYFHFPQEIGSDYTST